MSNSNKAESYDSYSFPGQRSNETIELIVRKHNIILISYFIYLFLMALMPVIFYALAVPNLLPAFYSYPYDRMFILFCLIYYGFIWIVAFIIWTDYYLDLWIITNQRLMKIEQIGFFNRIVSELDIKRIQDITSEVNGMTGTMFGFGDVHVQTASEDRGFNLMSIPHPVETRRTIMDLYEAAQEKDRFIFKGKNE